MTETIDLSDLSGQALTIYQEKLKTDLESFHAGEIVAIHVASGDYALARSSPEARRLLRARYPDGGIVTLEVGLPATNEHQVPSSGTTARASKQ